MKKLSSWPNFALSGYLLLLVILSCSTGAAQASGENNCYPTITLIGDSLLQGKKQDVSRNLQTKGYCVHDHSQGGQTIEAAVRTKTGRATNYYLQNTTYVLLGTNDFLNGKTWHNTNQSIKKLFDQIGTRHRVICLGQPDIGKNYRQIAKFAYEKFHHAFESLALSGHCEYYDLRKHFPDASDTTWFSADQVHLNEKGASELTTIINAIQNNMLPTITQ
jgi:lysophospholipase L1-like esterase